jgi:small subunit ribosomal protein S16
MLKIRLSRRGKKRQPSYRVVVTDVNSKRDGRIVERIGHYNPLADPAEFAIKEDRALHWLSVGAQPTDAVRRLLDKQGTFDRLGRMRSGESLDVLAAEVSGVVVAAPAAVEEAVEVEETVEEEEAEEVEEQSVIEEVVETVSEVAAAAVEAVEHAAETVVEAVEEVVSGDEPAEEEAEAEADDEAETENA